MTGSPALLAVCTLPPWPVGNGYALRVANILQGLATRWRITLLAPPGPVPGFIAEHLDVSLRGAGLTYPWRFDPAPLQAALAAATSAQRFDRALLWPGTEAAWFAAADLPAAELPAAVMDMIDCNPLEFFRGATARNTSLPDRLRSLRELAPAIAFARRTVRGFTATSCVGAQDAAWMRRIGGRDTVHVIPNGVAAPDTLTAEAPHPTVSFTGTLDYPPNTDAAAYLVADIWPRIRRDVPGAALVLAGRNPLPAVAALHGRDGIEVAADVPDMATVLGRSWVSLAPMRTGVGIKNKVLEAWACARPVVMTPMATNGLTLPPGHDGLVQSTPDGFADRVAGLLHAEADRHRLGTTARAHVIAHCSWQAAADAIDRLLQL